MLKINFNLKEGILGSIIFALIFPLGILLIFKLPFNTGIFDAIAPFFFLIFLIAGYINKESIIVGGILGNAILSYILKLNLSISILLSAVFIVLFFSYNKLFYKEPEKSSAIFLNTIYLISFSSLIGFISSLAVSINGFYPVNLALEAYLIFGLISTLVINSYISIIYGVKFHAMTSKLRKISK